MANPPCFLLFSIFDLFRSFFILLNLRLRMARTCTGLRPLIDPRCGIEDRRMVLDDAAGGYYL
jgi:hypothetical protein